MEISNKTRENKFIKPFLKGVLNRISKSDLSFLASFGSTTLGSINDINLTISNLLSLIDILKGIPNRLENDWFKDVDSLSLLIGFFDDFSIMLEDKSIKADVARLVSPRYAIRLIKLLTLGGSSPSVTSDDIIQEITKTRAALNFYNAKNIKEAPGKPASFFICASDLSQNDLSIHELIKNIPVSCTDLPEKGPMLHLLRDIYSFDLSFRNYIEDHALRPWSCFRVSI